MALLGKTDWYSAEKKIILTIALAILIASVSVFAILYLMMSHALQEDIRARARVVNAYAESHLNLEGFVHINRGEGIPWLRGVSGRLFGRGLGRGAAVFRLAGEGFFRFGLFRLRQKGKNKAVSG